MINIKIYGVKKLLDKLIKFDNAIKGYIKIINNLPLKDEESREKINDIIDALFNLNDDLSNFKKELLEVKDEVKNEVKNEIDKINTNMDNLEKEINNNINNLKEDINNDMTNFQQEIIEMLDEVRNDLNNILDSYITEEELDDRLDSMTIVKLTEDEYDLLEESGKIDEENILYLITDWKNPEDEEDQVAIELEKILKSIDSIETSLEEHKIVSNTHATKEELDKEIDRLEDLISLIDDGSDGIISDLSKIYEDLDKFEEDITKIEADAESFKVSVSKTYAEKGDVTGQFDIIDSKLAELELNADAFATTVSRTYAKKDEFDSRFTNIEQNMSQLNQTAEGFETTVSEVIAIKNDLTGKFEIIDTNLTQIRQTSDKIDWLVKSGDSESTMTLTDDAYRVISENISLKADMISLEGYVSLNGNFTIDQAGNISAKNGSFTNGTFSGNITGGTININDNFQVDAVGNLTTNETLTAKGGLYTYQDVRGLDDTNGSGGLTMVSGTGHVAVRSENELHNVYIQPASGKAYVTYPALPDNRADLYLKDLYSNQTNASIGSFGIAQLSNTNASIEFMDGNGVIRVAKPDGNLYLQCGTTAGNTSTEVKCTCYKDPNTFANIRAYDVCANNAVFANGVNVTSDRNKKRDIELYETDALNEICTTPVYTYHLDGDLDNEMKRIGIIMQEAPVDAIDLKGKGVDLYQMVTMLWKATQQQQDIINELKQEIEELKSNL